MDGFSGTLLATTVSVAFLHTFLGPDHWLPFVMLSRARRWRLRRTLTVTALCGLAHVASSVLLALGVVGLGWEATSLAGVEETRGDLAAWLLVGFGAAYALWGVRHALRARAGLAPHTHHGHVHVHHHGGEPHEHAHAEDDATATRKSTTFWTLFIVFALGPCEPMIPLIVAPSGRGDWVTAAWTTALFAAVTVVSMLALVTLGSLGFQRLPLGPLERWSHALAGAVVGLCGVAIIALGW